MYYINANVINCHSFNCVFRKGPAIQNNAKLYKHKMKIENQQTESTRYIICSLETQKCAHQRLHVTTIAK